ncbi:hypothetical protein TIFTF001_021342 [Ficus carica]|uniref:Uncharacterized protein n=1 Tax=Ficus carica TaxID=3494 RepID=A0AA88DBS6_FICCA|nr:hypothetical protein TIFTF001_021342 [Ficus carica]
MKHPFGNSPVPLVYSGLRQVQEGPGHRERRQQKPNSSENPPVERLEGPVPIPNRRNRHNREVNRVNPIQTLGESQEQDSDANAQHDNSERQSDLQSDPHPALGHIDDVIPSGKAMVVVVVVLVLVLVLVMVILINLHSGEDHVLLQVEDIVDDTAEENVNEAEADEDEEAGEELGGGSLGSDVTVADGAHGDDAEVKGVDDGEGLGAGEVVGVEGVDEDAEGEVDEEKEEGLLDEGGGVR